MRARVPLRGCVAAVACLLLFGCASVRPQLDPLHVAYIGTAGTEVYSTSYAVGAGAVETNAILGEQPNLAALIGTKVGGWLVLRFVESLLPEEAPRGMKILLWGVPVALQVYGTINNIKVGNRLTEKAP